MAATASRADRRIVGGRAWPVRPPATEESPLAEHPAPEEQPQAGRTPDGAVPAATPRRRRTRLLLVLAAVILVADIVTKVIVAATIPVGHNVRVLGGLVYLTDLRNTGAAFSFAEGATVLFTVIACAVAVVIVRSARRLFSTGWAIALGLVLGGALGNLTDRIFRAPGFLHGGVVDFISVFAPNAQVWPAFNLADSAIVCGGILGALLAVRGVEFDGSRARSRRKDDERSSEDSSTTRG